MAPRSEAHRLSRRRWVMLGFAFVATVINYLDRQALVIFALGPLKPLREFETTGDGKAAR